jgi:hypothetical protein
MDPVADHLVWILLFTPPLFIALDTSSSSTRRQLWQTRRSCAIPDVAKLDRGTLLCYKRPIADNQLTWLQAIELSRTMRRNQIVPTGVCGVLGLSHFVYALSTSPLRVPSFTFLTHLVRLFLYTAG